MKEYGTCGNELTRYKPIPGRAHPKEGSIDHAEKPYEVCRKRRYTMVKSRSVFANTNASGKVERFVRTKADVDATLDAPLMPLRPLPVGQFPQPNAVSWKGARSLRRAKRAMRAV